MAEPATDAYISIPIGICVDDTGNVYFNDWNNFRIRKINTKGIISTVAGNGVHGFSGDGGPADSAEISQSYAVAVDDSGIIYFDDSFNERIRKVDKTGIITTFAGNGVQANTGDGGLAVNAELAEPLGLAIDHNRNIYVSDFQNVRKINRNDTITTIAGNGTVGHSGDGGPATNAELGAPEWCGLDDSGNVYIGETYREYVRKINLGDTINTIAGNGVQSFYGEDVPGDSAEMSFPMGATADKFGNVYFSDNGNNLIRKLSPCSHIITLKTVSPAICRGDSVTLNITGANTYTWSPASGLSNTSGISVIASPTVTTTYTITGNACTATATITVTVDSLPVITFSPPSPVSYCSGQTITLIAGGASSYQWDPSTGLNDTTGDTVIANPTATTTYTITGTGSDGCTATGTEVVSVIPSPNTPTFHQHEDTLVSSSEYDNQWYRNDTLLKNDTSQDLVITILGEYWVVVTNEANGCNTASDSMDISTVTGINQLTVESGQLTVYPNPTLGQFTIQLSNYQNGYTVEIYNVMGEEVYQSVNKSPSGDLVVNLGSQPAGMYFVYLKSGEGVEVGKVLVTK